MKKKRRIFMFYAGILLMAVLFPGWIENQEQKQGAEERKEVREALKYVGDSNRGRRRREKKIALTFDDGPTPGGRRCFLTV